MTPPRTPVRHQHRNNTAYRLLWATFAAMASIIFAGAGGAAAYLIRAQSQNTLRSIQNESAIQVLQIAVIEIKDEVVGLRNDIRLLRESWSSKQP